MLAVFVLLLVVEGSNSLLPDCAAVFKDNPTSVKKTKAWKKCDGEHEALMDCQSNGYKFSRLLKAKESHILCVWQSSDSYQLDYSTDWNTAEGKILQKFKKTKRYKNMLAEKVEDAFLLHVKEMIETYRFQAVKTHRDNLAAMEEGGTRTIQQLKNTLTAILESSTNAINEESIEDPTDFTVIPMATLFNKQFLTDPSNTAWPSWPTTPWLGYTTRWDTSGWYTYSMGPTTSPSYNNHDDLAFRNPDPGFQRQMMSLDEDGNSFVSTHSDKGVESCEKWTIAEVDKDEGRQYLASIDDLAAISRVLSSSHRDTAIEVKTTSCYTRIPYAGLYHNAEMKYSVAEKTIAFKVNEFENLSIIPLENVLDPDIFYTFMGISYFPGWRCEPDRFGLGGIYGEEEGQMCQGIQLEANPGPGSCFFWGLDNPMRAITIVLHDMSCMIDSSSSPRKRN